MDTKRQEKALAKLRELLAKTTLGDMAKDKGIDQDKGRDKDKDKDKKKKRSRGHSRDFD